MKPAEDLGVGLRRRRRPGIALALIPEHALDLAAGELELPEHRAIQAIAPLVFLGGVPLLHAGAAVGAGDQADGDAGRLDQRRGERQARARPLSSGSCGSAADRSARVLGSPEWTGSGESTSQWSGSSACDHLPSIPSIMT